MTKMQIYRMEAQDMRRREFRGRATVSIAEDTLCGGFKIDMSNSFARCCNDEAGDEDGNGEGIDTGENVEGILTVGNTRTEHEHELGGDDWSLTVWYARKKKKSSRKNSRLLPDGSAGLIRG